MSPRVLVIGRTGQLALALAAQARPGLVCAGRPDGDIAFPERMAQLLESEAPDVVINAGAYTAVDRAEFEAETARLVNAEGPGRLAELCHARGVPLIHVSTDCVFDGTKPTPYTPDDLPLPLSVYGQSKLDGERAVAAAAVKHLVVRVSWVFSEYAHNFVRTMLSLARTREAVSVVSDQVGFPTYCPDLAQGLLRMADRVTDPGFSSWGTYHLAGDEAIDRARMAREIFALSASFGGPTARVVPVLTADYPTPAKRPLNAQLDSARARQNFGIAMPDWRSGLRQSVSVLVREMEVQ